MTKIKEILEFKENADYKYNQLLKDYDELQQEHEKWWAIIKDYERDLHDLWNKNNELEEKHSNEFQCWKRDRKELLDKRARIEKAVEYINYCDDLSVINDYSFNEKPVIEKIAKKELLNILNGRNDE